MKQEEIEKISKRIKQILYDCFHKGQTINKFDHKAIKDQLEYSYEEIETELRFATIPTPKVNLDDFKFNEATSRYKVTAINLNEIEKVVKIAALNFEPATIVDRIKLNELGEAYAEQFRIKIGYTLSDLPKKD